MDALPVTAHHLNAFREAWKTVDPTAKRWVSDEDCKKLLGQLPRQIGFDDLSGEDDIQLGGSSVFSSWQGMRLNLFECSNTWLAHASSAYEVFRVQP